MKVTIEQKVKKNLEPLEYKDSQYNILNGKQTKNCSLLIHPRVNLVLEPVLCAFLSRLINQRMNKFALSSVYFTLTRGISLWARVRISTVRWF